jgi:predicted nucleic acid-binding protein
VRLSFDLHDHLESVSHLISKYHDTPMSLADACLVRMSELHTNSRVFTLDSDFKLYRRNNRQTIPLIFPAR